MERLTVLLAHSDFEKSIANKTIIEQLKGEFKDVDIRDLSKMYPNFNIDIEAEQNNLIKSDVILLQFPIYWYNMPAILKHWLDTVLSYGFAYGEGGDKLKGKTLIVCTTAGGREEAYTPIGHMHFYLRPLINNIEATAYYCQMNFHKPILGYANIYIPNVVSTPEFVVRRATEQAHRLIDALKQL